MYSKKDFMDYFLDVNVDALTHRQLVDLFQTCIKHDSFKLAFQIYCRYIKPTDITQEIINKIMNSLKDSVKFHEIKMFFIHEHFDVMDVEQLNQLVEIFLLVFKRSEYKYNPMLSQYNTVKYALLVFRVSWRIEKMKVYSLITKC